MCKALLLAASLLGAHAQSFPGTTWPVASRPEEQGFSSAALREAFEYAFPENSLTTYCAAVFRNGVLVHQQYNELLSIRPETPQIAWSVTKAIFATLIGILEKDGILKASDLASDYITEWRGVPGAEDITIDHLLRHDSGRYYEFFNDFIIPQTDAVSSQTDFAINLPMQSPVGSADVYNQMAQQCMERIWRVATGGGKCSEDWFAMLPRRLGFEHEAYLQEQSFLLEVPNGDGGLVYGGVNLSCRDLGRFGHLWLNNGNWNGDEIVTPEFYDRALRRASEIDPVNRAGRRYHWGGPPNVRANGFGQQFVSFNKEKDLVIVRMGDILAVDFASSEFIDRVMTSLVDGPGSWDVSKDAVNDLDEAEVKYAQYLQELKASQF